VTSNISKLQITYRPVGELKDNPRNARTHSKPQIRQIANSITEFGFNNPVLLDAGNTIIAGHGRVAAAKLLGLSSVPTIRLLNLSPDEIRAYVIADNRLAEKAGWDRSILAIELQHLATIESDFDVIITGFDIPEIDLILSPTSDEPDADDVFEVTELRRSPRWVISGCWANTVWFAEARLNRKLIRHSWAADEPTLCLLNPPYNVRINGHVSGNGSVRHREFPMAAGEMTEFEFVSFLSSSLRLLARYSSNGSIHFVHMDWRHMSELLAAGKQVYDSLLNLCVWVKNSGGMGSFYRSQHELVFVFRNGKGQHRNNVQLGRYGRNRTNVWEYPGVNTFSKQTDEGNLQALHPTVKPVALVADALLDCSARGEVVLDAFLGSGSTLIAAERTGRICHGIELDPIYVDTAVKRWQHYTGDQAIHASTGKRFDEIAAEELEAQHG
jgi:DNA methylase/ParB-like nuclease domain